MTNSDRYEWLTRASQTWLATVATLLLGSVLTVTAVARGPSAQDLSDDVQREGGWAYKTARETDGTLKSLATTRAVEDDIWLVVACDANERLEVALVHGTQFPFSIKSLSAMKLWSNQVPAVAIEVAALNDNVIGINPIQAQSIMPRMVRDQNLTVGIYERNGASHEYTFRMQPNNALASIRDRCLRL